jgi:hypothetical protein
MDTIFVYWKEIGAIQLQHQFYYVLIIAEITSDSSEMLLLLQNVFDFVILFIFHVIKKV